MTLDEAIKHCYEVADRKCDDCGKEHLQLAKWLEELQDFKNKADYVEVVRCKDCVAKKQNGNLEPFVCTRNNILVYDNCFCSYGERSNK